MNIRHFLAGRNIEFSLRRYGIDALNFMALGLFGSLICGLILQTVGGWLGSDWLTEAGGYAKSAMGAAIGVGVSYALKAPPLVFLASAATGMAGAALGGPVGCFVAAALGTECGKLVSRSTPADIVLTPTVTLAAGIAAAQFIGPFTAALMTQLGSLIGAAVVWQPLLMSMAVAVIMGMLLTLPVSSAAVAIALSLDGTAAGAATVGCCAQMVGFAVMGFRENGWGGLLSQGLGTSMLQMPNIVRNPKIWLPPTLAGALIAPLAVLVFEMKNIPMGAGMGTSGLVGQVGTFAAMGNEPRIWLAAALLHFILPAALTLLIAAPLRKIGWIREGDLKLNTRIG
ncbi:MAG: PTS sugar transporter subunit IIC [Neisseria sp.]|nr:PTS sugar transporter subunit IIC [Neisseria sp.]